MILNDSKNTRRGVPRSVNIWVYSFAPEAVTVKCKEKDWFPRGIAEAIWIAKENP